VLVETEAEDLVGRGLPPWYAAESVGRLAQRGKRVVELGKNSLILATVPGQAHRR
jgi:hypothetical protein